MKKILTKKYTLSNDISKIVPFIESVCDLIKDIFYTEDLKIYSLGLYEVIMNAIEHGNLHILYDSKKEWLKNGIYKEKLKTLLESDIAKKTSVKITLILNKHALITEVEDDGYGFDPEYQFNNILKDGNKRENGRGMILIKSYFDDVKYNEKGNKITLTKYKHPYLVIL